MEIRNEELILADSRFFHVSGLQITDDFIFDVKTLEERPYEFDDRVHFSISFEMNLNLDTAEREVYHFLDWIGDLGGLLDGVNAICLVCVVFFTYKTYDNYMASKLF